MPRGVYVKKSGVHGKYERTPEIRAKIAASVSLVVQENANDPEWRQRVSDGTKTRMHDPVIRQKHLEGLKRAQANKPFGAPFSGTYSSEPNELELSYAWLLSLGYAAQVIVVVGKNGHHYTLDYALVSEKICIEIDGSFHKRRANEDAKRDQTLKALGWKVIRVRHWS